LALENIFLFNYLLVSLVSDLLPHQPKLHPLIFSVVVLLQAMDQKVNQRLQLMTGMAQLMPGMALFSEGLRFRGHF
jgi:hypothetical protein